MERLTCVGDARKNENMLRCYAAKMQDKNLFFVFCTLGGKKCGKSAV